MMCVGDNCVTVIIVAHLVKKFVLRNPKVPYRVHERPLLVLS